MGISHSVRAQRASTREHRVGIRKRRIDPELARVLEQQAAPVRGPRRRKRSGSSAYEKHAPERARTNGSSTCVNKFRHASRVRRCRTSPNRSPIPSFLSAIRTSSIRIVTDRPSPPEPQEDRALRPAQALPRTSAAPTAPLASSRRICATSSASAIELERRFLARPGVGRSASHHRSAPCIGPFLVRRAISAACANVWALMCFPSRRASSAFATSMVGESRAASPSPAQSRSRRSPASPRSGARRARRRRATRDRLPVPYRSNEIKRRVPLQPPAVDDQASSRRPASISPVVSRLARSSRNAAASGWSSSLPPRSSSTPRVSASAQTRSARSAPSSSAASSRSRLGAVASRPRPIRLSGSSAAVDLVGEELVELLGKVEALVRQRRLGRRQAGEADHGRPAAGEGEQAGAHPVVGAGEQVLDLVLAHRQHALPDLEHLAVENAPGRDPARAGHASRSAPAPATAGRCPRRTPPRSPTP